MFQKILFSYLLLLSVIAEAQKKKTTDTLQTRVVLIGDAGSLVKGRPSVLNSIKEHFKFDDKTTVIFLGDNLYDYGLPDETFQHYSMIVAALDSQINLIKGTKAKAIMIPGNHDWANGGAEGYEHVVRQQQYVDRFSASNMNYYPKGGCPGPEEIKLSKDVVLVIMDSQWWLHTKDKPGVESDCDTKTEEDIIEDLKEILNKNYDKLILLATHHPFKSNGPHGGYYTWKQHIFPFTDINKKMYIPLPVIGSVYPITRSVFGTPQDIKNPNYTNMINKIMSAVKTHPNVIMVSGHEHNLQYLKDSSYNYIISGSGCKTNRVSPGRKAEFSKEALGFATLDISNNKNVGLTFYTVDETRKDSLSQEYAENILNFSKLPKLEMKDTVTAKYVYKDFVKVPASNSYKKLNGLKKIVNGKNYRKEWSEPVQLKVFNINKEKGGFTIEGLGGGNQTKSLKLKDKKGLSWSLRTIDKDPEKAIPENFRNSFASSVVKDMISASYPYGPVATVEMEKAAGLISSPKEFFFVPDDPSLGYYRPLFANKVCMLELKEPNRNEDNKSTFKLIDKIREENDHTVNQNAVLNARLMDMLIGDWDRHFDQWRWASNDTGKGKTYFPMPKDRDQAFFYSEGLLRKLLNGQMPFLKGLSPDLNKLSNLNMVAKDFDHLFLNGIPQKTWDSVTQVFISNVTDEVIRKSIRDLPPEIYKIRGEEIEKTLINRRNMLKKKSTKYYRFLAEDVTITGSNQNELYKISSDASHNLLVTGYSYNKQEDTNFIVFNRKFSPAETREIKIFAFNGEDKFVIDSTFSSDIKIHLIGGKGNDTFLLQRSRKIDIYDVTAEKNYQSGGRRSGVHFSVDPAVNAYNLKAYRYPYKSFPRLAFGYNVDDGILLGGGFLFRNYKFRREPFANEHRLTSLFALTRKGFQLKYNGTFNKLIRNTDLLINTKLNNPGINNFYGLGNETKFDKPKNFYIVRYKTAEAEFLFRSVKFDKISLYAGPTVFHYWNRAENNKGFALQEPEQLGLDSLDVYSKKTYLGAKAGIDINNVNSPVFPTRGINWENRFSYQKGIDGATNHVSKLESDMTVYASLAIPARVTGVIKLGAGKIFSDSTKYFQALTLGQNNNLRGFRKNRFAGDALAYGSLELRIKLAESRSYLLPGQFGVIVFNDIGRVWYNGEKSNKWHYAYGGGLYFVPFNTAIVSATIGRSEDTDVFNISIGTKFNITF